METTKRNKRRDRRSYTPEFKSEIVDRCRAGDRSIAEVARDFDLTESAVRRWVAQAEIDAGRRVRYFTAPELVDTLSRGLADNSVGKVIDQLLRADLVIVDEIGFAPLDDTGAQLLFRLVAAAYERVSLGIASHWPFDQWGRFLPEQTTAVSLLDRLLHHSVVVLTDGESFRMREARQRGGGRTTRTS